MSPRSYHQWLRDTAIEVFSHWAPFRVRLEWGGLGASLCCSPGWAMTGKCLLPLEALVSCKLRDSVLSLGNRGESHRVYWVVHRFFLEWQLNTF